VGIKVIDNLVEKNLIIGRRRRESEGEKLWKRN
jgi:hypothetical protein